MQEASKFPRSPKKNNLLDISHDNAHAKDARDTADQPELKVTFERPAPPEAAGSLERQALREAWNARDTQPSSEFSSSSAVTHAEPEKPDTRETPDALEMSDTVKTQASSLVSLEPPDTDDTPHSQQFPETPTTLQLLKMPLLAIAAASAVVMAGWSYATLEETRAQLASVTQAKASVDNALADAQGKLAAAEKAVANVKAALTMAPAAAAVKPAAPVAEPAAVPPPSK